MTIHWTACAFSVPSPLGLGMPLTQTCDCSPHPWKCVLVHLATKIFQPDLNIPTSDGVRGHEKFLPLFLVPSPVCICLVSIPTLRKYFSCKFVTSWRQVGAEATVSSTPTRYYCSIRPQNCTRGMCDHSSVNLIANSIIQVFSPLCPLSNSFSRNLPM